MITSINEFRVYENRHVRQLELLMNNFSVANIDDVTKVISEFIHNYINKEDALELLTSLGAKYSRENRDNIARAIRGTMDLIKFGFLDPTQLNYAINDLTSDNI